MTKCCCLIVIILCTIGVSNSEGLTRKCRALNGKCGRKNVTCDDTFGSGWASEGRCCNERPCCKYSTVVTSYSCGFESDEPCIFKNSLEYDFAWTRTNNTSPTNNTGTLPQTPAKGNYYIYVELSSPAVGKAVLTTEAADLQASPWCLSFQYYMKGNGASTLTVKAGNKTSSVTRVWYKAGGQPDPDMWKFASIEIPQYSNPVITIGGDIFGFVEGDIAIDDILLVSGSCEGRK